MACIFCGASKTTREHVWPRRLLKELPGKGALTHTHEREGPAGFTRSWETADLNLVVRSVCAACTGGWMARLDSQALPLVVPMALGRRRSLTTLRDKAVLCAWAIKLGAMFDQTQAKPILQDLDRERLYHDRLPPRHGQIWLASVATPEPMLWAKTSSYRFESSTAAYEDGLQITFRIHHVVLQILIPPTPEIRPERHPHNRRFVIQLWPLTYEVAHWPPEKTLRNENTLGAFATTFLTG